MLRQVYIILNDEIVYQKNYSKGIDSTSITNVYMNIKKEAFSKFGKEIGSHDYFGVRIAFIAEDNLKLLFLFVISLTDDFQSFESQVKRFKKECQKTGLLTELRRREFYEKPSVTRKRAQEAAVRKHRRKMQKIQSKLDMM